MKRQIIGIATASALSILISGCANTSHTESPVVIHKAEVNALEELKSISIEARHELRLLAKAQESISMESMTKEQHAQKSFQAIHVPRGFDETIKDFVFTGPANKAAEAIAKIAGYKIKFQGKAAAHEPWVNINLVNQPLNEALKEIGIATGDSIVVEVHSQANVMLYVYKNQ
jgi:hypothetical protein